MPTQQTLGWREGVACALLPVVIELASALLRDGFPRPSGSIDADTAIRLVRLRDIVAAHSPLHAIARDGSGHGTILHWSHFLDSLLLMIAAPFGWLMPTDAALFTAGLVLGMISLAGLGFSCAWAVAPCVGVAWRWIAPTAAVLTPAIWAYGQIGIVHHHLLAVLVAVVCWGWSARLILQPAGPGAIALGAWAATGLWMTPETVPLSVLGLGAVFLAWVGDPRIGSAIRTIGLTMFGVVLAAFLVDPPATGYAAQEFDRISLVFVGVAAVFAALGCAIPAIGRRAAGWQQRFAAAALVGAVLGGAWLLCFPAFLRGSDTIMSEAEWHAFFGFINEMQPVATGARAVSYLLTPALAALFLVWLAVRHRSVLCLYAAAGSVVSIALAQRHVRFAPYPEAVAVLLLPVALTMVERHIRRDGAQMAARLSIVVAVLIVPIFGALVLRAERAGPATASCRIVDRLDAFGDAVTVADVNASPELLYRTQLRTVGSLYHRNPTGFLRLRAAWRSRPDPAHPAAVPPEIDAAEATLVIFCPNPGRSPLVADLPADTLLDRLDRGEVPPWLREAARIPASGNIVFRVVR